MSVRFWLMKSEPTTFSIHDLIARPNQTETWDGVRNFEARNHIKSMKKGEQAFFYHSSCKVPGIVGIVEIVSAPYPDLSSFDPESPYFDPKNNSGCPTWWSVDVQFKQLITPSLTLEKLHTIKELNEFRLLKRGNRLSVIPVSLKEWNLILTSSR